MPEPAVAPSRPEYAPGTMPLIAMPPGASPRTLLLVEDSRLAAEAVHLICRRAGIRLRRAESLASAALHLRVYRPDIALVDLGLPDGSGLDLIAALARGPARPHRLVAVSGEADGRAAALAAGADAFLLKPLTLAGHLTALVGTGVRGDVELGAIDRSLGLGAGAARATRNAGADPLALRDDLRRVRDLLNRAEGADQLRHAGQLLASVGQALCDPGLTAAAQAATRRGDRAALVALARDREGNGQHGLL